MLLRLIAVVSLLATMAIVLAIGATGGRLTSAFATGPVAQQTADDAGATPTVGSGQVRIRVVNDEDRDATQDPGEQGIPGISIQFGCSDAIVQTETDEQGYVVAGEGDCVRVGRPFGWLPVTSLAIRVPTGSVNASSTLYFFLHDLGDNVMEIPGEAIDAGLPAREVIFEPAAVPYTGSTGCVESFYETFSVSTETTAIVVGNDTRPGCLRQDDEFSLRIAGQVVATETFVHGLVAVAPDVQRSFVINGDSMRFYNTNIDRGEIDGVDCAVIIPVVGFVPPDFVRVFLLSEQVRPGCGAPGRSARFFRDGAPLDPLLPWQAGSLQTFIDFQPADLSTPTPGPGTPTPTPRTGVQPPNTGAGPADGRGDAPPAAFLLAVAALALGATLVPLSRRRRRSVIMRHDD